MLSFQEIKELVDLVSEKGVGSIEIERAGFRIRIEGRHADGLAGAPMYYPVLPETPARPAVAATPAVAIAAAPATAAGKSAERTAPEEEFHYIASPIVGTFYRSPSPETLPFASPGDRVEKGKILCIIEAMKLMNEIESDISGEIVEVFPQNGQPVEYGEKLFAIRAS